MFSTESEYIDAEVILHATKYSELNKKQQELLEFGCFFNPSWTDDFKSDLDYIRPESLDTLLEDKPDYFERLNPISFRTYEYLKSKYSN